jgi:DNA-directed RNA polymerase specialized sigma24 family protein
MEGSKQWEWVLQQARQVLSRYRDAPTRAACEDIAQEASLLTWKWADRLKDDERLGAAVRTIARRHRNRSLIAEQKRRWLHYVDFAGIQDAEPDVPEPEDVSLCIGGRTVALPWARRRLARVLSCLPVLDQKLLLGFHEGFCCAELASRFGRTEDCIKSRICRARRRVRTVFEDLVRSSGDLEEPELEEER